MKCCYKFYRACVLLVWGLVLAFGLPAHSQTAELEVEGALPNVAWTGDALTVSTANCPAFNGGSVALVGGRELVSDLFLLPPAFASTSGTQITIPWYGYRNGGTGSYAVYVHEFNGLTEARRFAGSRFWTEGEWTQIDTVTHPALSFALASDTVAIRLEFSGGAHNNTACVDDVGPVRLLNSDVDCSAGGCGGTTDEDRAGNNDDVIAAINGIPDYGNPLEWLVDGDDGSPDIDFEFAADAFDAFTCGDPVTFVADRVGGGGLLKKILGYITSIAKSQLGLAQGNAALNCKADVRNEVLISHQETSVDIYEGQTQVSGLPSNANFSATIWDIDNGSGRTASDAVADSISALSSGIEDDNLITATARTNRLLVANMRTQAALSDRIVGPSDRPEYQNEGGRLIEEGDLDLEAGADFAEGDYEGTAGRIRGRAAPVEPDYETILELDDQEAEFQGVGACLAASAVPPSGDGSDGAFALLRWNASQRLAASNFGNFICSVVDQPPRNATEICFGPEEGFTTGDIDLPMSGAGQFCVFGPDAPAFSNRLFGALPLILLMFAALSVFKMFFN